MNVRALSLLALIAACGEQEVAVTEGALPPPADCMTPPSGMVGWWTFDEVAGPIADDTAGAVVNAGAWQGGVTPTAGQVDGALTLDGVDDFVEVADDPELDLYAPPAVGAYEDLTIDAWVRVEPGTGGGIRSIVDKRAIEGGGIRGYTLFLYNGQVAFQMADASVPGGICGTGPGYPCTNYGSPAVFASDGQWHLVAVTVRRVAGGRSIGRLYYDGAQVATFSPRAGGMDNSAPLWIGKRSTAGGGGSHFVGGIDEVEIFKRALSANEIAALYQAGPAGKCKETCDGTDDDGDGLIDEGYPDSDGDGVADCVDPRECVDPPADMTAWWTLDEPTGGVSFDDAGGIADDGAWTNGVTPIPGQVDDALTFDGVDDYVAVPHSADVDFAGVAGGAQEDFSFDAWVRVPAGGAGVTVLLDKRTMVRNRVRGYSVFLYNNRLGFQMADASAPGGTCGAGPGFPCTNWATPGAIPADGQWHLVAVTVDRAPVASPSPLGRFYIDGVQAGSFTPRTGSISTTAPLEIGRRSPALGGGGHFRGDLDEIELFKRVLTPAEVLSLYGAGPLGKCKEEEPEPCNGLDDDGDGLVDEDSPDADNDGIADCVDVEYCNCEDDDGDGQVDEGPVDTDGDGVADARRCQYGATIFLSADDTFSAWLDSSANLVLQDGDNAWYTPAGISLLTTAGTHLLSVEASDLYGAYAGFVGYVSSVSGTWPTGAGLWQQTAAAPPAGWQNTLQPGWAPDAASVMAGNCAGVLPGYYATAALAPLYGQGAQWTWIQDCSPQVRQNWFQLQFEVCPEAAGGPVGPVDPVDPMD